MASQTNRERKPTYFSRVFPLRPVIFFLPSSSPATLSRLRPVTISQFLIPTHSFSSRNPQPSTNLTVFFFLSRLSPYHCLQPCCLVRVLFKPASYSFIFLSVFLSSWPSPIFPLNVVSIHLLIYWRNFNNESADFAVVVFIDGRLFFIRSFIFFPFSFDPF